MLVITTDNMGLLVGSMQNSLARQGVTVTEQEIQSAISDAFGTESWEQLVSKSHQQDETVRVHSSATLLSMSRYNLRNALIEDCTEIIRTKLLLPNIDNSGSIAHKLVLFGATCPVSDMSALDNLNLADLGVSFSHDLQAALPKTEKVILKAKLDGIIDSLIESVEMLKSNEELHNSLHDITQGIIISAVKQIVKGAYHPLAYFHAALTEKEMSSTEFEAFLIENEADTLIDTAIQASVMKEAFKVAL